MQVCIHVIPKISDEDYGGERITSRGGLRTGETPRWKENVPGASTRWHWKKRLVQAPTHKPPKESRNAWDQLGRKTWPVTWQPPKIKKDSALKTNTQIVEITVQVQPNPKGSQSCPRSATKSSPRFAASSVFRLTSSRSPARTASAPPSTVCFALTIPPLSAMP